MLGSSSQFLDYNLPQQFPLSCTADSILSDKYIFTNSGNIFNVMVFLGDKGFVICRCYSLKKIKSRKCAVELDKKIIHKFANFKLQLTIFNVIFEIYVFILLKITKSTSSVGFSYNERRLWFYIKE